MATKIKCTTKDQIAPVSGAVAVRVSLPSTWTKGQPLLVCAVVHSAAHALLVPMPNSGYVKAKTIMSIETATPAATGFPVSDADPTGANWSWCS